jgi:Ca2+-binding RTX toxin-like protein
MSGISVDKPPGRTPQAATAPHGAGKGLLDGGTGADRLVGGTGDDTNMVDSAGDVVVEGADTVRTILATDTLAANVENPVGTGGAQALAGDKAANVITASGPDDTLAGGDTNRVGAGHGVTTASGEVDFGAGITDQHLWFLRSGNDLHVDLMGTTDHMTISGWYADNARVQTQSFDTADGMKLDTQVAQLVTAMAAYLSAHPGFDPTQATQVPDDRALQATVVTAWHP